MKSRVLFVDDERALLDALRRMLRNQADRWDMTFLDDSLAAWEHLQHTDYDAVIVDVKMARLDGLALLQRMRTCQRTRDVPVVVLTGLPEQSLKRRALNLGATDLLNKPVEAADLEARIRSVLRLKSYQDELRRHNSLLEQRVLERTRELARSRLDIIWRLAKAIEFQDEETGSHVVRVGCYSRIIAETMGLARGFVEAVFLAAPLHDIGKIGISDSILFKPAQLTRDELSIVQEHTTIGDKILREDSWFMEVFEQWRGESEAGKGTRTEQPILEMAASIALNHHEKWDGTGYPRGLAAEEIPLEARIVALSDVFDALTSQRPYKPAFACDSALETVREAVGRHFDPRVHQAFETSIDAILGVRERFCDGQVAPALAVCRR